MTVDVKVGPIIREFVLSTNGGSDLLRLQKDDMLWLVVKQHLVTVPKDYKPLPDSVAPDYIRIELLNARGSNSRVLQAEAEKPILPNAKGSNSRTPQAKAEKSILLNTLFRSYLSEKGQRVVADRLKQNFKECFLNFVQGAVHTNPHIQTKEAIKEFCELHRVPFNNISYDMLVKSWQRSKQRKNIFRLTACPLIF